MIETVLLAFLVAKVKKYKIKPLFKSWTIYPVIIFCLIYLILEITLFNGIYFFIKYTKVYEILFFSSIYILVIKYKQYFESIIASFFILLGSLCNHIAITNNGGKMPIFPKLSYITGYIKPQDFHLVNDIHTIGSAATKLKFLTDIFDVGYSIMSIGDIFIRFFVFFILFSAIKYINGDCHHCPAD